MNCMYLTKRSKKYSTYWFCRLHKKEITLDKCKSCSDLKYKEIKAIKKKTKKQVKLENSRYSIITNDLKHCYICTKKGLKDISKEDLHEIYGGSNRKRSIENGLVVPLCRKCHQDNKILKFLQRFIQKEYEKTHTREEFIKLIGKSYIRDKTK